MRPTTNFMSPPLAQCPTTRPPHHTVTNHGAGCGSWRKRACHHQVKLGLKTRMTAERVFRSKAVDCPACGFVLSPVQGCTYLKFVTRPMRRSDPKPRLLEQNASDRFP